MADITLTYKGNTIAEISDSGTKTLETGGTYCEADIEVEYVKPSGGGSVLPSQYQQCEYIENQTTAFLTLPVAMKRESTIQRMWVELDVQYISARSATSIAIGTSSGAGGWFGLSSNGILTVGQNANLSANYADRIIVEFSQNNSVSYIFHNSELISRSFSGSQGTTITVFNDPTGGYPSLMRVYRIKISDFVEAVADMVPCYNKSTGEVGMYDFVSRTFIGSSNSSSFVKGADV